MALLVPMAVSSLDAGCFSLRLARPSVRRHRSSQAVLCRASEFLARGETSARLFAAAATAAPCRRALLESTSGRHVPLAVRAGLGDYATVTSAAYGATLFLGGLFAFVRTGSKGSLGGGLTGAALYGATYYLLQSSSTESLGNALGFGTGLLFSAVFAIRLFATGKPVPAGPLLGLSALVTAVFASAYFA